MSKRSWMTFFSGFCLRNESALFKEFLGDVEASAYVVAGFSYGAQKALEYALESEARIDRLLLLSPAWFLDKSPAFVKLQMRAFAKERKRYLERFFENAIYPASIDLTPFKAEGSAEELEALLTYPWEREKLRAVAKRGVRIEIYLGAKDRIVDANRAHGFFREFGESWLFKPYGHFLQGD
jgi:pimeloyl-ACP methyl ester carboxylesterase